MEPLPQVNQLVGQISDQLTQRKLQAPLFVGIHTGGVWIAEKLHALANSSDPLGTLDISFYRDDFSRVGLNPQVKASNLPIEIEQRNLVLVDDVLHTGRTIRAALNELFSYGRPASVTLVVLIDRPGRELPIQADVVGQTITLSEHEQIRLQKHKKELILNLVDASTIHSKGTT